MRSGGCGSQRLYQFRFRVETDGRIRHGVGSAFAQTAPFSSSTAQGGDILQDGVVVDMFGINWFGMETRDRASLSSLEGGRWSCYEWRIPYLSVGTNTSKASHTSIIECPR